MTKRLSQNYNWSHFLRPVPPQNPPRVGFHNILDWLGLTWGNNLEGGDPGDDFETIVWTTIPDLDAADLNYYVSATGSDSNNGLTDSTPKLTLAAGIALLRDGHGDRLMLKKGDTFTSQTLGSGWTKSGASSGRPMIIGAYGTGARPIINTGTSTGLTCDTGSALSVEHFWIMGIELYAGSYVPGVGTPAGINWYGHSNDVLFEDLYIHNFYQALVVQGQSATAGTRHTNVSVRACTLSRSLPLFGLYAANIDGLTVEWCNILQNGWTGVGDYTAGVGARSVYIQNKSTSIIFRNNIVTDTNGAQVRPGGSCTFNVFSRTISGLWVGYGDDMEPAGITAHVEDNVTVECGQAPHTDNGGSAHRFANLLSGSTVARNIVCNGSGHDARGLWFQAAGGIARAAIGTSIDDNVFHNHGGRSLYFESSATDYSGNSLTSNVFQNPGNTHIEADADGPVVHSGFVVAAVDFVSSDNHFVRSSAGTLNHEVVQAGVDVAIATWLTAIGDSGSNATEVTYVDPDRTLGTYNVTLGGADDHDEFTDALRTQSKDDWDDDYTAPAIVAYFKEGFTVAP